MMTYALHCASILTYFLLSQTVCSALGICLPTFASTRFPFIKQLIAYGRAFGVGVVLSVSVVHMWPESNDLLTDPCLGSWPDSIPNLTSMIVLASVLLTQGCELYGIRSIEMSAAASRPATPRTHVPDDLEAAAPAAPHVHAHAPASDSAYAKDLADIKAARDAVAKDSLEEEDEHEDMDHCHHIELRVRASRSRTEHMIKSQKDKFLLVVLELSIALHSILIGVDLGFQPGGTELRALLIALCFHQFFEGLTIGSALSRVPETSRSFRIVSTLTFSLMLPLGVAIGLGIRASVSPTARTSLIARGCLDALATGVLLYTALVPMLNSWYTQSKAFRTSRRSELASTLGFIYFGAIVMSALAKWA